MNLEMCVYTLQILYSVLIKVENRREIG